MCDHNISNTNKTLLTQDVCVVIVLLFALFVVRELFAWFFKNNAILCQVQHLKNEMTSLNSKITALLD